MWRFEKPFIFSGSTIVTWKEGETISKIVENPYSTKPWLKHYDAGVPPSIDYPSIPLYQIFYNAATDFPDRVGLNFMGRKWTFKQSVEEMERFATALSDLGVKKGDVVAIALPNFPQFYAAYFGTLRVGGIVVSLNPTLTPPEFEYILNDSGVETVVAYDMLLPIFKALKSKTNLKRIIITGLKDALPGAKAPKEVEGAYQFLCLLEKYKPNPPNVKINPKEDVAVIQYTGGTTGVPKGAMLTHYNLTSNAVQIIKWSTLLKRGEEIGVQNLPLFHIYGMTCNMNAGLLLAASGTMNPDPRDFTTLLALIREFKPTIFLAVPTMFIRIMQHKDLEKSIPAISRIKICNTGAAPMPPEVLKKFQSYGMTFTEGYGLTECSPVTHSNPQTGMKKIGSIGLPIPDTEILIVDTETHSKIIPVGEPGELVIKGPQVMKGYWNKPEETKKQLVEELFGLPGPWVFTGDVAKMDGDGYFYIVDRTKDMINVSGLKVYPREVDDVLFEHPAVAMAAVVGVPDPKTPGAETVKAFIVPKQGYTPGEELRRDLIEHCQKRLARYKVPKIIEFRDNLPLSLIGKVLKRPLREEEKEKAKKGR
nr:long-chain fatty acid--CoA ligase [Candidatus Njordarchaeota archaeon]